MIVQEDADLDGDVEDADDHAWILLTDDRGTLMGVADKDGDIVEKLHYNSSGLAKPFDVDDEACVDAYGNQTYASTRVRFGFTGMYREPFSGKYHTHYRDYDPLHAVWLSRDPIRESGGYNLTGFCEGDPVNGVDALGLEGGGLVLENGFLI